MWFRAPVLIPVVVAFALSAGVASAAGPVVVDLRQRVNVRTALVCVGDVARVSGGDPATRDRIARLDLAELKLRDPAVVVSRRVVEYRVRLAGLDPGGVAVTGADRVAVELARRPVTAEEVFAAARAELLRRLPAGSEPMTAELAQPIIVRLPEVPAGEPVVIAAVPHSRPTGPGRVQMDVTISAGGERLLGLAVYLEVKATGQSSAAYPTTISSPTDELMIGTQPARQQQLAAISSRGGDPKKVGDLGGLTPDRLTKPRPSPAVPDTWPPYQGPAPSAAPLTPVGAITPMPVAGPGGVLVRPRQRVSMAVRSGALTVTAVGEAQQEGRLGQMILVQNVDSKKTITARVTGPGAVEVELGAVP